MARRQRPRGREDQENAGLQRPPPPSAEEEPHRFLCLVISFPGVILLGIAAGLTIFLISLKSNNNSEAIVTSSPSPEDQFWFDFTESRDNDDMSLSFPTRKPTLNPTRIVSNLVQDDDNFPLALVTQMPTQTPSFRTTSLPTQADYRHQNARNRFQQVLESRSTNIFFGKDGGNDDSSPQAKAQNWLIRDPQFYSYSDDRLVQRWVLATFAFGMVSSSSSAEGSDNGGNALILTQQEPLSIPQAMQNWVEYTDECTHWFYTLGDDNGKTVCNSNGLYERLDLRLQNLVGTLPSEIALLSNHLRYIHLLGNGIHGTLPTEFGLLAQLGTN